MKVFVCNIPWSTTEQELQGFVEENGYSHVGVKIVTDRDTGRSRGFGFLTFESDLEGERALAELDGVDFMGRTLQVLPSTSPDRSSRGYRPPPSAPVQPIATPPRETGRSFAKKAKGNKGGRGFAPRTDRFASRRGDDYDLD